MPEARDKGFFGDAEHRQTGSALGKQDTHILVALLVWKTAASSLAKPHPRAHK